LFTDDFVYDLEAIGLGSLKGADALDEVGRSGTTIRSAIT
jgi:hypothetical protein